MTNDVRMFNRWARRLRAPSIAHQDANRLGTILDSHVEQDGRRMVMTAEQVERLWSIIHERTAGDDLPAAEDSTAKGIAWLARLAWTPGGAIRRSCPFDPWELGQLRRAHEGSARSALVFAGYTYDGCHRPLWRLVVDGQRVLTYYVAPNRTPPLELTWRQGWRPQ